MLKEKEEFIEKIKTLSYNFNINNIRDYKDFILLLDSMLDSKEEDVEILEAIYNVIHLLSINIQQENFQKKQSDILIKNTFSQRLPIKFYNK